MAIYPFSDIDSILGGQSFSHLARPFSPFLGYTANRGLFLRP